MEPASTPGLAASWMIVASALPDLYTGARAQPLRARNAARSPQRDWRVYLRVGFLAEVLPDCRASDMPINTPLTTAV